MSSAYPLVVVGASVAAEALIRQLRDLGDAREVLVIDADANMPYERPPLSKAWLSDPENTPITVDWEDLTEITHARAVALDPSANVFTLEDPENGVTQSVTYDNLVIATGATPVRLPFEPDGVGKLRTMDDSDTLRAAVKPGVRVGIIGAGAIGCEVASSLRALGAEVELFDLAQGPLERLLAGHLGETITEWLTDLGIACHWGVGISDITGEPGAWQLHLTDRDPISFDVLISAVGVRPEIAWLTSSGVLSDRMLLCDSEGRVLADGTPLPNVYGVGDVVTRKLGDGSLTRTESWSAAVEHGVRLAFTLTNSAAPDPEIPYFWSDVAGKKLQVLGAISAEGAPQLEFENPERGALLYRVVSPNSSDVGWIGINAQPKIAQLRFAPPVPHSS